MDNCFTKAATRRGGTERGRRMDDRARKRRTEGVLRLTLLLVVVVGWDEGACGSGNRRVLEESSMSGFRAKEWRVL